MVDLSKIDRGVLNAILNNMDYYEAGPEQQKAIMFSLSHSSPEELMDKYLNWEGIIGYTSNIIKAWEAIKSTQESNALERLIQYNWDDEYTHYMEENDLTDEDDVISHALVNKNQDHIFCALAELRVNHG